MRVSVTKEIEQIRGRIKEHFDDLQAKDLDRILRVIYVVSDEQRKELEEIPKKSDFNRLEQAMTILTQKVTDLTEAQMRTEKAQRQTEERMQDLIKVVSQTNIHLGGLGNSMAYAFENEAYRILPEYLKKNYGIEVVEKFIRKEIAGKEINVLAQAKREGKEIVIIGEATLKLDEKDKIDDMVKKINTVKSVIKEEMFCVLVTHYATKSILKYAQEKGITVIQSFEW